MKRHAFVLLVLSLFCVSKILTASESKSREILCANLSAFHDLWKDNAYGKDPNRTERAAWITQEIQGSYELVTWPTSSERSKELWHGALPIRTVSQVHTHPQNGDERPSAGDTNLAARIHMTIYVISSKGVWSASPQGRIARVADRDWYKEFSAACPP